VHRLLAAALVLASLASGAAADGILVAGDYPRVDVVVGKTVEQNVGYHRYRWFCDDPSLLTGDLITKGDANYFVITGVKAGSTQCRVGTDREGFTVLNVFVAAAPTTPPKKAK
jgi:opacity protein-like surface antigen